MMKRYLLVALIAGLAVVAAADIPSRRLDGSFGKGPAYTDDYPYTPLDWAGAESNPLKVGLMKTVAENDPAFAELTDKIKAGRDERAAAALRAQYVKSVEKEFELTEKEAETVKQYPDEFPVESKRGKRVQVSEILALNGREYDVRNCVFLGRGDWNGDGKPELFLRYDDGATHAGASSEIRVFTEAGDFVWSMSLMTLFSGWHGLVDVDGDGTVELVVNPGEKRLDGNPDPAGSRYLVLACARPGLELTPFSTDGDDSSNRVRPPIPAKLSPAPPAKRVPPGPR